jgi:hypothetical protein
VPFKIHYRNNLINKKDYYLISCPPSWDDRNYSYGHQLYPSEYGDRKPPLKHNIKSKYNYGRLESTTSQKGVNLHFVDNNNNIIIKTKDLLPKECTYRFSFSCPWVTIFLHSRELYFLI